MTILRNRAFNGQVVVLDYKHFKNCTFEDCELVYHGNGLTEMTECTLSDVSVSFDGPARKTLSFLEAISQTELVGSVLQVAQQLLGSEEPRLFKIGDDDHLLHWPRPQKCPILPTRESLRRCA